MARETRGSGNATVAYAYDDPRLLLTGITRGGEVVSYGYTASGEKGTEQSPSGLMSYRYDALDRLQYVDSPRGTTQVTWEPGGARLLDVAGPTLTECRRYDERGRLRFVASVDPAEVCETTLAPLSRFDYGYDDRGNRLREEYQRQGQPLEVTQYGYDLADRLTSVVSPSGAETRYGLGGDGSRLTEVHALTQGGAGTTETYHYDARGGLTSITDELGAPVATYTVDVAGRVLSEVRAEGTKSLTWDAGGRLVSATVEKTLPGGGTVTDTLAYRYDHAGLRIWKQGPQGEMTYLWGDGELVDEVLPSGTRVRYERAEGMALAAGGEALLHDGLGSVVGRVAAVAPVYYRYDAWGRIEGQGPTGSEASLAYAGQHWDEDLGLSYAQQRWYQPGVGRFLSEDPVFGDPTRPNTLMVFAYAAGNPLLFTDPTGEAVRVSAEEQKSLRLFYGAENVTFTPAGLLGDTFDVTVSDAGFAHIKEYVQQTKGSAEYAQRLSRAILDPFWRYASLGSVSTGDREWIGQKYEGMVVSGPSSRDPRVVSAPEDATGSYGLEGGFAVPTKPYSHTTEAVLNQVLPQFALLAVTILTPVPGDEGLAAGEAATARVAPAAVEGSATRTLTSLQARVAANLERSAASPWLADPRAGVASHLERFRDGGSFLVPKTAYERFVRGRTSVGRSDGLFMTTRDAMNVLLREARGDLAAINRRLGTKWNEPLYRVDVTSPLEFNIRMPSGLETGANEFFRWGGYTSGGMPEAVTDPIPAGGFTVTPVTP